MTTTEQQFERALEIFRAEEEQAAQFYYAFQAVREVVLQHKSVSAMLRREPLFWKTCLGALQTAAFIALGRIFDHDGRHNLEKLLCLAERNHEVFSKAALARRRQGNDLKRPDGLDEYLQNVYEPTPQDFRRLRARAEKWRLVYDAKYRPVRNKYFAHKVKSDEAAVTALFSKVRHLELQRMLRFLGSVHQELQALFVDGRRAVHRPARYSVKEMMKKPVPMYYSGVGVQEHITRETREFLIRAARQ